MSVGMRKQTLELLKKQLSYFDPNGLEQNASELRKTVETSVELIHSLFTSKTKIKNYEKSLETLIFKLTSTSFSILKLTEPTKFRTIKNDLNAEILDFLSIYILTRSVLECYLTIEYIYFNQEDESEKFFRFKLWEVSGLISRQKFGTVENLDFTEQKQKEKELIDKLKKELESGEHYPKLSPNQIKNLNKYGLPKIASWHKLIEDSSLNTERFSTMYSLFSSYSHSEFLSILQIKQSTFDSKSSEPKGNIAFSLTLLRMIHSRLIMELKSRYKSAELVYNTLPNNIRTDVEIWSRNATN